MNWRNIIPRENNTSSYEKREEVLYGRKIKKRNKKRACKRHCDMDGDFVRYDGKLYYVHLLDNEVVEMITTGRSCECEKVSH